MPPAVDMTTEKRRANHHELHITNDKIVRLNKAQLDAEDLRQFNIDAPLMALDGSSDVAPTFFTPCQWALPPVDDQAIGRPFPAYDALESVQEALVAAQRSARELDHYLGRYLSRTAVIRTNESEASHPERLARDLRDDESWRWIDPDRFGSTLPLEEGPKPNWNHYEWFFEDICQDFNRQYPHLKATMISNIDGDVRLTRGELLMAIRLQMRRLKQKELRDNVVAPVLLFSFMDPQHVRVIESYYNGYRLVVKHSRLFDFRTRDDASLQLLASWANSRPTGDTLDDENPEPPFIW
ncbi:hypothetical protein F5884DRAFT_830529 [Xylogone sp. PMI_703]|nr:hypothetical protein F5884DRAFT_830529 [Xylogone sp. PMI_703]